MRRNEAFANLQTNCAKSTTTYVSGDQIDEQTDKIDSRSIFVSIRHVANHATKTTH